MGFIIKVLKFTRKNHDLDFFSGEQNSLSQFPRSGAMRKYYTYSVISY